MYFIYKQQQQVNTLFNKVTRVLERHEKKNKYF